MIITHKVHRDNFLEDYLTVVNSLLGLTNTELRVFREFVSIFMEYGNDIPVPIKWKRTFSTENRKKVKFKLKLNSSIDFYIKSLKDKGAIKSMEGDFKYYRIIDIAIPKDNIFGVKFEIHD